MFSTFQLTWPAELAWLFEISAIFMFDLNGLGASCFHGSGFAGKYWATIMVPLFVIACTGVGYLATQVLPVPEAWKMLPNQTISMLGMLLTALYITLVKVVVAFWECVDNPSAGRTLAKYKDVVCSSDEHNEVLPAMALGLILYVIGGYFGFLHAAYVAPSKWMDVTFRERWKFMLTRWRPDTYYWGSPDESALAHCLDVDLGVSRRGGVACEFLYFCRPDLVPTSPRMSTLESPRPRFRRGIAATRDRGSTSRASGLRLCHV